MLTESDIVTLLSRDGSREDMLRAADAGGYRRGLLRAAELCIEMRRCSLCEGQYAHDSCDLGPSVYECADAIRAEANCPEIPEGSGE